MNRVSRAACFLFGFLIAAGGPSAGGLAHSIPGPAAYFIQDLSAKDRLENFETAWKALRDNYYDPAMNGINWNEIHSRYLPRLQAVTDDREFYELLDRMAGELHDAHTRVLSPQQAENFKQRQHVSLGFRAEEIEGSMVVTDVIPESDAAKAGIAGGMIVRAIDGTPTAERLEEAARKTPGSSSERATSWRMYGSVLGGKVGSTIKLELERTDGSRFEATLTRGIDAFAPHLVARLLPSGNAYISFDAFFAPAAQEFKSALSKFLNAPALIIDLRRNPGGASDELFAIAGTLFAVKTELVRAQTRSKEAKPVTVTIDKNGLVYSRPVVVLVGERSGSSAELFTAGLQEVGRVKVVGGRTCGCVLGVNRPVELKGGGLVMISKVLWSTLAGRKLEGEGVLPDKVVTRSLDDIRQKRDVVLEEGERMLKTMTSSSLAHTSSVK